MARKSIKGYAEKNYYDNTKFSGGIVATNDPLNEGYFKNMVNFDITDTGQSIHPRKGFITTTLFTNEERSISKDAIFFYDVNLGEFIFVDFKNTNATIPAWRVTVEVEDNYIRNCKAITNIEVPAFLDVSTIVPVYTNQAVRILDEYAITSYMIKVKDTNGIYWLKLYYREAASSYNGIDYPEDTLIIDYVNMDDVVEYVNTAERNLASTQSIIPDPMQQIYKYGEAPVGHLNLLPMIYAKQDGKYLINEFRNIEGLEIIPHYLLEESDSDYLWAYTYDIISTNRASALMDDKALTYKAPVRSLQYNKILDNITGTLYSIYKQNNKVAYKYVEDTIKNLGLDYPTVYPTDFQASLSDTQYIEFINKNGPKNIETYNNSYVIYVVPHRTLIDTFNMDLSRKDLIGACGLMSYFTSYKLLDSEGNDLPGCTDHNNNVSRGNILNFDNCCYKSDAPVLTSSDTIESYLQKLYDAGFMLYIEDYNDDIDMFSEDAGSYQKCKQTKLNSNIYAWDREPMNPSDLLNNEELLNQLKDAQNVSIVLMNHLSKVNVTGTNKDVETYNRLFSGMPTKEGTKLYYVAMSLPVDCTTTGSHTTDVYPSVEQFMNSSVSPFSSYFHNPYNAFFYLAGKDDYTLDPTTNAHVGAYTNLPLLNKAYDNKIYVLGNQSDLFEFKDGILTGEFNSTNNLFNILNKDKFFDTGLLINFYIALVPTSTDKVITREALLNSTNLYLSRQLIKTTGIPSTYIETITTGEPELIAGANNSLVFNSVLGDHLVLYTGNKVFVSKEGKPYYYTQGYMHEFPEPVVKVIQYKDMLLVFSTQNLYAIYLYEDTTTVLNGTDDEGNPQYVQQKVLRFAKLPVLYNLLVNEKYKDAIQVYNQMVLFYSSDGQMFLIKPTAAIDSNTRFSIQYFNKSANDILLNYKEYMQERLNSYNIDKVIEDVDIKVSASINYIKVFYSAKDIMTYILVYDVLNNRYYTYDTLSFRYVNSLHYIPDGEMYLTEAYDNLYFTTLYHRINAVDNNVDISVYDNFSPYPINAEIDTGTINLNNHLKKRFKDLHVIYKNLNANSLEFFVETFVDDIPIITHVESTLTIQNLSKYNELTVVDKDKVTQLVENIALFNFIDYNSNKIITHRSNIISRGKTIRIKMNFNSKGKYKIQGYGLIYKEHTV